MALGAAAVALVGLTGAFGSITGAQSERDPIRYEVVSVDPAGARLPIADTASAVTSHSGAVVAFEAAVADSDVDAEPRTRVWIRDRAGATSRPVAERGSASPGISGNGCTVAYSVVDDAGTSLRVVDRCSGGSAEQLPLGTLVDTVPRDASQPAPAVRTASPALSFDGSTIVWSTGREIRRYSRPAAGTAYGQSHAFDVAAVATSDSVTGPDVDVSDDGDTVVFTAGDGSAPYAPTTSNVYVWTTDRTDPELLSRTADDLPGESDSTSPTVSSDGSFVVFASTGTDLAAVGPPESVLSESAPPDAVPFVVAVDLDRRSTWVLVDDATGPVLSADAHHVAYRRGDTIRVLSDSDGLSAESWTDELAGVAPTGPIAMSQHGRWIVFASATVLSPGDSTVAEPAIWAADRHASDPSPLDSTTSSTSTSTVAPGTTAPPATSPTTTAPAAVGTSSTTTAVDMSTVPATTLVPTAVVERFERTSVPSQRYVFPSSPRNPVPTPPRYSSSTWSPADFDSQPFASAVVFEPTVANAGRRTQSMILTNAAADPVAVAATSVEPTGPFTIITDGCGGSSIQPGGSCAIDVQFAPTAVGFSNALVTFHLADGSVVTATVEGEGANAPTLDVVPAVAGAGQTVTVFGAGFPPGALVEFTQPGAATPATLTVDGDGTFAHVIVVLPNTPTGPVALGVSGQPDAFADVTAELLVSSRGTRSSDPAVRGRLGSSIAS